MLVRARLTMFLAVAASACALGALDTAAVAANARGAVAPSKVEHLTYQGSVNLQAMPGGPSAGSGKAREADALHKESAGPLAKTAVPNPSPTPLPLAPASGSPLGFVGITAAQQGALNGFDLEPPDQGLCAHNGTALEAVNLAIAAYTESGQTLKAPVSLNSFFREAPVVSGSGDNTTFGPFLSDPRCYYDAQTQRWFVTSLEIDVNPTTGAFADHSHELIAVSRSSDPTGDYAVFSLNTTNNGFDGTPVEEHCPCFGDQPRIGADANGFYVSTDSYPIHGVFNSNGGEIYAISKQGLAAAADGGASPAVVAIHNGAVEIGGHPANAVQPAETPEGGSYAANREYFLNTPDFNGFATMGGAGASSVVLWTLSDTSSLASASPEVTLSDAIIPSEAYTPPVPATQRPGPRPLGESLGAELPTISVNDDRMQQVEYVGGTVYSSLNTAVGSGSDTRSGVAWFAVSTHDTRGTISDQGYLATGQGASLMYPAIGLKPNGVGVMTFSVSGPSQYPSAAYVPFANRPTGNQIDATRAGTAPEDGFTCYAAAGFGPSCRWGDYSAASSDGSGNVVMGGELIPDFPRDPLANWGTFISTVRP